MHRQVGDLVLDERGLARRGLLVRHLVMPNELAGTGRIAEWLAKEISPDTYINVMGQYHPAGDVVDLKSAAGYSDRLRPVSAEELHSAIADVCTRGLHRLDQRRSVRFIANR